MKLVGWEQLATQGVPRWQVHKVVGMGVPTTAASFRLFDILLKFSNLYTTMLKYLVSHIEIINNVMERFFNLLCCDII